MFMSGRISLRRLARDKRGVSAVEFALVSPLMIGLYLGCVEISDGVASDRKVTLVAATVANLVAQSTALSATDMSNIFDASTAIMAPYSTTAIKITVSCLAMDANKNVSVKWSETRNGSKLSGAVSIPSDLKLANSQLVYATVSYPYKPTIGYTITGTLTLSEQMYMMPRITAPSYPDTTHTCT
jgi:Flp pilus assembly protein TadG